MKKWISLVKKIWKNPVVATVSGFVLFVLFAATAMFLVEGQASNGEFDSFFHSLWFSIVTITTVGYGDISPVSPIGQGLTIFVIFVGIGYSGVLTGSITSWLVERTRRKTMGLVPLKNVEGKFLVCGWKPNMRGLLKDILKANGLKSADLVLLNQMDPIEVQSLRKDPLLEHFSYYSGDDTNIEDIKKAGTESMGTVMVLVDYQPGKSDEEIDFKSVVTAHEVEHCNDTAYQIVELNLVKYTSYLKRARVEEVILNRVYGQVLLCNMALMSGFYSVFQALFSLDGGLLQIRPLDHRTKGQTYGEIKVAVKDAVVIGLLENVGKISDRKEEKLSQIQKSTSIAHAISELSALKTMMSHEPLINPPNHYLVPDNCYLLVVSTDPGQMNLVEDWTDQGQVGVATSSTALTECSYTGETKGQLMILGWKAGLIEMIQQLVDHQFQPYIRWQGITLVADIHDKDKEEIEKHFSHVDSFTLVVGDVTNQDILVKAGLNHTEKVLILAETGRGKTFEEIDAQSVLACMQIADLNKKAYVTAEFLSKKYLEAMIDANVEEHFLVDEFNNIMLANASCGMGMSKFIRDMINQRSPILEIHHIPSKFVGASFEQLCCAFNHHGVMSLGLLEEAGNMHVRKMASIHEAQVQGNISASVSELMGVKHMTANHLMFAPPYNHIIDKYSRLIILRCSKPELWGKVTAEQACEPA